MWRKSTFGLVSVLVILLFACVEGRNLVSLPWDGEKGDFSFLLNDIPIIEQVTIYSSTKDPPSNLICDACLHVSETALQILSDPKLPDKIASVPAAFCHILPPQMEAKCLQGEMDCICRTISYLTVLFRKQNLCYSTGLCSTNAKKTPYFFPSLSKAQSLRVPDFSLSGFAPKLSDDSNACTTCHNAIDAILIGLDDPKTKMKILKLLLKTCKEVEDHVPRCEELVFEYAPVVLARLQNYLRNNDLCTSLELCNDVAPPQQLES